MVETENRVLKPRGERERTQRKDVGWGGRTVPGNFRFPKRAYA